MTLRELYEKLLLQAADMIDQLSADVKADIIDRYDRNRQGVHPALQSRFERDMAIVIEAEELSRLLRETPGVIKELMREEPECQTTTKG